MRLWLTAAALAALLAAPPQAPQAQTLLETADAGGAYAELRTKIRCPQDQERYGDFHDYGYWGGGPWCGQEGPAGYWVWMAPVWYVWGAVSDQTDLAVQASLGGKYANLISRLHCPEDEQTYGALHEYGHWGGGRWCGAEAPAGYWVYAAPYWHIWSTAN